MVPDAWGMPACSAANQSQVHRGRAASISRPLEYSGVNRDIRENGMVFLAEHFYGATFSWVSVFCRRSMLHEGRRRTAAATLAGGHNYFFTLTGSIPVRLDRSSHLGHVSIFLTVLKIQSNNKSRSYKKYLFKKYWQAKCQYASICQESGKGITLQFRISEIAGMIDLLRLEKKRK